MVWACGPRSGAAGLDQAGGRARVGWSGGGAGCVGLGVWVWADGPGCGGRGFARVCAGQVAGPGWVRRSGLDGAAAYGRVGMRGRNCSPSRGAKLLLSGLKGARTAGREWSRAASLGGSAGVGRGPLRVAGRFGLSWWGDMWFGGSRSAAWSGPAEREVAGPGGRGLGCGGNCSFGSDVAVTGCEGCSPGWSAQCRWLSLGGWGWIGEWTASGGSGGCPVWRRLCGLAGGVTACPCGPDQARSVRVQGRPRWSRGEMWRELLLGVRSCRHRG